MSSNRFIEIAPTNVPSNGKISYKNGLPVIQFIIGASEHLLLGSSIRVTGDFIVNINTTPTVAVAADAVNMDCKTGIYSTFDQLVLKNHSQFATIEHIKNYNRFMASYLPVTSSIEDTTGHFGNTALTMPNYNLMKTKVVDSSTPAGLGEKKSFSVHLPSGFLLGQQPIYLGRNGINGLVLEIHLSPDNNVLFSNHSTPPADIDAILDAYYEFSNLKLTAELVTPDPATLAQLQNAKGQTYQYNSIASYYSSINSANAVINFNLGLRNVLGAWCNFISAERINNFRYNGMSTRWIHNDAAGIGPTANIKNLIWTRGGTQFPENYNTQTLQRIDNGNITIDPAIQRSFMDAIVQFSKKSRTQASPNNTFQQLAPMTTVTDNFWIDNGEIGGIGMSYDQVSNQGVDFSTSNFGIQMQTGLITNNPTGLYLFIHSKQTLVFNGSGIQVLK